MTNMTELTAEKLEEIRKRYRPTEVPKCHICGAEMTIQRMSASRITYGCTGAIYDETGCHYAEGRSLADDHYAESRITVVDVSDPDVLAMVEALEKAQQERENWRTSFDNERFRADKLAATLSDEIELVANVRGQLLIAHKTLLNQQAKLAKLESRTVKLPAERFCPAEYAGSQLWSETEVWNKAITACADALRATGIKVEVE
ncbi:TPA: ead/Ea22-like family protein [Klebsiella oxytoca]|nr:ead/Ea22-like family protein [Klebsiella oxytoca]